MVFDSALMFLNNKAISESTTSEAVEVGKTTAGDRTGAGYDGGQDPLCFTVVIPTVYSTTDGTLTVTLEGADSADATTWETVFTVSHPFSDASHPGGILVKLPLPDKQPHNFLRATFVPTASVEVTAGLVFDANM